jgi:hypothetical protein
LAEFCRIVEYLLEVTVPDAVIDAAARFPIGRTYKGTE